MAAAHAGAGAEVDDHVGGAHGLFVMLDHNHSVAQVAEALQRIQQAALVSIVQPDARLVQHVQHTRQAAADLRGQANPLRFSAAERRGGPIQRQVVQAYVTQKRQAVDDLPEHLFADLDLCRCKVERLEEIDGLGNWKRFDFGKAAASKTDGQRLSVEAGASAHRAARLPHVFLVELADRRRFGFAVLFFQLGDDAGEGAAVPPNAAPPFPFKRQVLVAGAV